MIAKSVTQDAEAAGHALHRRHWALTIMLSLILLGLLFIGLVLELLDQSLTIAILWRVYTPPTLTEERVAVYTEFIRLVQKHHDLYRVSLDMWGELNADRRFESVDHPGEAVNARFDFARSGDRPSHELTQRFSQAELDTLKDLYAKLGKVNCMVAVMVDRADGYRFFRFQPCTGSGRRGRFVSPAAVYVVDPRDPNDVDAVRQATGYGDLEHIKGCWYASRSLGASRSYPRGLHIPKSVFDHSLDVPPNLEAESATLQVSSGNAIGGNTRGK